MEKRQGKTTMPTVPARKTAAAGVSAAP